MVRNRLEKAIKGLQAVQNSSRKTNSFNGTMDFKAIVYMIDALIRFERVDLSDPVYEWLMENESHKVKASDLLKLLRSVSL